MLSIYQTISVVYRNKVNGRLKISSLWILETIVENSYSLQIQVDP